MFLYKHSFVTIYLQVSVFAQMSENWAPGTDRQAGHPLDVHVSPVGAQVRVPLPLWASGCPRLPQACLCRWGCPANTQPHAAHCFNSNLIPASFSSFSSRTPPPPTFKKLTLLIISHECLWWWTLHPRTSGSSPGRKMQHQLCHKTFSHVMFRRLRRMSFPFTISKYDDSYQSTFKWIE